MQTIYVLWIRQLKRFWRYKSRIVAALGQPLLYYFTLGFGMGPIYQQATGQSYIGLIGPGIIAMTVLFTGMFTGMEMLWDRQVGFLKETLVAPVSRTTIIIGRTLAGATVAFLQGALTFVVLIPIGFHPANWAMVPIAAVFLVLIALLASALGTLAGSILEDTQSFPVIMNFVVMPLFFLSGALFPLDNIPGALRVVTRLDPLAYGVDGMRAALSNMGHLGIGLDMAVLAAVVVVLVAVAAWFFRRIEA